MKLYHNGNEFEVALYSKLTPALYDIVTPLLQELANTKGATKAAEQEILEKVFSHEGLAKNVDLTKGEGAFVDIMQDFRFQEIVKTSYLKIRQNLFEVINIDSDTIPKIIEFTKKVIDRNLVKDPELLVQIDSDPASEFWQNQDLDSILDSLKFFRESVCARIKLL
jgi:hypothetical protein